MSGTTIGYIPCYKKLYAVYADESRNNKFFKIPIVAFALIKHVVDKEYKYIGLVGVTVQELKYLEPIDERDIICYDDGSWSDDELKVMADNYLKMKKEDKIREKIQK